MFKEIERSAVAAAIASVVSFALVATSWAQTPPPCPLPMGLFDFDFNGTQYADCFRDVVRGDAINAGMDFGSGEHTSLNIAGSAGPAGRTWVTVVDQDPGSPEADVRFGSGFVCADVLIERFNNRKGAGVVALYNQDPEKKGLALIISNAGNSDRLVLATVDGDANGKLTQLTSVPLNALIDENNWYRVVMTVFPDGNLQILGQVYKHATGTDPNSAITPVGPQLRYTPAALPPGVDEVGEEGIIGWAVSAVENSSVTNFTNVKAFCDDTAPPPPPSDS